MRLLERDRELAVLDGAARDAASGQPGLVVVEGAAGIGKTRLLAEARARAVAAGLTPLWARGSELEREFAFGVVRQLFEGILRDHSARERVLAGPAAAAQRIFAVARPEGRSWSDSDASFASLHGLYWLVANLNAERPLMLALDDLQWCDTPSLRFLAYLLHRLEDVPVLIVCTVRSSDEIAEEPLLCEVVGDPFRLLLRPHPLSKLAVSALVSERLGAQADDEFSAACHVSTGGNPLLLEELVKALDAELVIPEARQAQMVVDVGSRAVSRAVLVRLARLGDDALAFARALSIFGEGARQPLIAALAGVTVESSGVAQEALVRAEIVRQQPELGFVHPLVAAAVYRDIASIQRQQDHQRAAELLMEAGAPVEQAAAHLLKTRGQGEQWVVDALRQAAKQATSAGAPESAITYLGRALAEPPEQPTQVLLELGRAELLISRPDAARHLLEAYEGLEDPVQRGRVAGTLARALLLGRRFREVADIAARAQADLPPAQIALKAELRCAQAMAENLKGGAQSLARPRSLRVDLDGDGVASRMLAAMSARECSFAGGSSDECARLAHEALAGGELIAADNGFSAVVAITTLARADRNEALEAWQASLAEAHRGGSLQAKAAVSLGMGYTLYRRGELADAERWLRTAMHEHALWQMRPEPPMSHCACLLAVVLLERGELSEARVQLDRVTDPGDSSESARYWLDAELELLLTEERFEQALTVADDFGRRFAYLHNPVDTPWRSHKALGLDALGRRGPALELAREDLGLAREWGAPGSLARALRVLGSLEGDAGIEHLHQAVAAAAGSPAHLEHAKALMELGRGLRRRQPREARLPLTQAIELANRCGAIPLAERARSELYAAGGRPRAQTAGGRDALTASELRVAGRGA